MLDKEGYRPNVGIILANQRNEVFWGKRVNQHAWQFPQGGIKHGETPSRPCTASWRRRSGCSAPTCASSAARATGCATRCPSTGRGAQRERAGGRLPRPEADLVPAAPGRARLRRQPARERPSRVRRLALARLLGAARDGDRLQARRLPPGADRAASLPARRPRARRAPQPARGSLRRDDQRETACSRSKPTPADATSSARAVIEHKKRRTRAPRRARHAAVRGRAHRSATRCRRCCASSASSRRRASRASSTPTTR